MVMRIKEHAHLIHADNLQRGLKRLGPEFIAEICYWCKGTGSYKFEHCHVCGKGKFYGTALGLLQNLKPAPESVVNQVLVAAKKEFDVDSVDGLDIDSVSN